MSLVIKKNSSALIFSGGRCYKKVYSPLFWFDSPSLSRSCLTFFETISRSWKSLFMEETSSESLKNKHVNMKYHEELKGNRRRPYTKAAEGLTSILLMLLVVLLNQEKLDFFNSQCPTLSNLNVSSSQRTWDPTQHLMAWLKALNMKNLAGAHCSWITETLGS